MAKTAEEKTTYQILHEDGTERRITVPSSWKVTFGPAAKGMNTKNAPYKVPLALRFYEADTKQRAIFTDVVSFRDLSIEVQVKKISKQEKQGYMECDGQRKATVFHAEVSEWVNPDEQDLEKPALPSPEQIQDFDVKFETDN